MTWKTIIVEGPKGGGKSTWIENYCAVYPHNYIVLKAITTQSNVRKVTFDEIVNGVIRIDYLLNFFRIVDSNCVEFDSETGQRLDKSEYIENKIDLVIFDRLFLSQYFGEQFLPAPKPSDPFDPFGNWSSTRDHINDIKLSDIKRLMNRIDKVPSVSIKFVGVDLTEQELIDRIKHREEETGDRHASDLEIATIPQSLKFFDIFKNHKYVDDKSIYYNEPIIPGDKTHYPICYLDLGNANWNKIEKALIAMDKWDSNQQKLIFITNRKDIAFQDDMKKVADRIQAVKGLYHEGTYKHIIWVHNRFEMKKYLSGDDFTYLDKGVEKISRTYD